MNVEQSLEGNIFDSVPPPPKPKVVIEIKGGQVQHVYTNGDIDVKIIDRDNIAIGQDPIEEVRTVGKNDLHLRRILEEAAEDYKTAMAEERRIA